jgi:hypothetical protein
MKQGIGVGKAEGGRPKEEQKNGRAEVGLEKPNSES